MNHERYAINLGQASLSLQYKTQSHLSVGAGYLNSFINSNFNMAQLTVSLKYRKCLYEIENLKLNSLSSGLSLYTHVQRMDWSSRSVRDKERGEKKRVNLSSL